MTTSTTHAAMSPSTEPATLSTMQKRRDVRRLAMQILYQFDVRGFEDRQAIIDGLDEAHEPQDVRDLAMTLADAAWNEHGRADVLATELAPDWPTHRQPPVDRAILRLAVHEMTSGKTPVKVAINEAVELAKQFGSEQTPAFLNGVLDKAAKQLDLKFDSSGNSAGENKSITDDPWLADAINNTAKPDPDIES